MPKAKGKGGKNRRRGKNDGETKRELAFKEAEGQGNSKFHTEESEVSYKIILKIEYAQVIKMLGNCRLEGQCFDGKKRLCHIRGNMRKKVWISAGDIVLVSLREFEDDKCDVILKYSSDEARSLKAYGELPDSIKVNEGPDLEGGEGEEDIGIDFDDEAFDEI